MDRENARALLARLHAAQNTFYSGGGEGELRDLLAPDVVWHVPGVNAIAGAYRGHDDVLGYFTRRRELAASTFRIRARDVLTGDGDTIAALSDGAATLGNQEWRWSTVGLYRVADGRIAECWLLPTDPGLFDLIWSEPG